MSLADTINKQIETANDHANKAIAASSELVDTLQDAVDAIDSNSRLSYATTNTPTLPDFQDPEGKPGNWTDQLNEVTDIILAGADVPGTPQLFPVPETNVPEFLDAGDGPTFTFPTLPNDFTTAAPTSPGFDAPTIPTAPTYTMPTAPTLTTITVPSVPEFSDVPTFTGTLPTDIVAPEIPTLSFTEEDYTSALTTAAEAWLADTIANGGTGLDASVEQAIFDRSLAREVEAARRNLENALDEFAPGFSAPSGALNRKVLALRADLTDRTEDLNRKIAEDQARLAQDNTQFALSETLKHEAVLLQHHNAVADRALAYAKSLVDVAVAVYELKVAEYNVRLDGYRTEAQVFGELIKAAALEIEHFRAELEVTKTQIEVDAALVDRYQSEIEAVKLLSDFYNSQLAGAKIEADIEAVTLQAFRAEIDAYVAEARAKELEYSAYRAGVEGEKAKADVYRAEVDAVRSANEGKRGIVDAEKIRVDGVLAANRGKLDLTRAQTEIYRTQIEQNASAIRAAVDSYIAQTSAYRANIEVEVAKARVGQGNAEIALENAKGNVAQLNETYRLQGKLLSDQIEAAIGGAASGVESTSARASAALSQINTVSQIVDTVSSTA